jgi:hypothetical protein
MQRVVVRNIVQMSLKVCRPVRIDCTFVSHAMIINDAGDCVQKVPGIMTIN